MVLPRTLVAVALLLLAAGTANARALKQDIPFMANAQPIKLRIQQAAVPYALTDLEPVIDAQTMNFHYGTHYAAYVNNTNDALANASAHGISISGAIQDITGVVQAVKTLPFPLNNTIRAQGGGAWNHALYFKQLAAPGSAAVQPSAISPELQAAITRSFRTLDNMTAELTGAAAKVFGSGWSWLCYTGSAEQPLTVSSTPNQDNPLMGDLPAAPAVKAAGCTPILGIDVWEHAYYLKHGPKRPAYLEAFWQVLSWQQVSKNYASAVAGDINTIVA